MTDRQEIERQISRCKSGTARRNVRHDTVNRGEAAANAGKKIPVRDGKADHVNGLGRGHVTGQRIKLFKRNNVAGQRPSEQNSAVDFAPECTAKRKAQSVVKDDTKAIIHRADCREPRHRRKCGSVQRQSVPVQFGA